MSIAIVFDMDGVLIDSVGSNWSAINKALEQYDVSVSDDEIGQYLGRSLLDQVLQLNAHYNLDLSYVDFEKSINDIKRKKSGGFNVKAGVFNLLGELQSSHIPLAVATSMPRIITEQRLDEANLLGYFDVLVTSDDVASHKPSPEVYLAAFSQLGTSAQQCVIFEDAPNGIMAAKAAESYCIAISTPYVKKSDLKNADTVIQSLEDINLKEIISLLNNN